MEFGRYNPNSGITVYSVDMDFDFEEEFRISFKKAAISKEL